MVTLAGYVVWVTVESKLSPPLSAHAHSLSWPLNYHPHLNLDGMRCLTLPTCSVSTDYRLIAVQCASLMALTYARRLILNSILIPVLVNDCVFHCTHWLNLHSMLTIWLQTLSKCVPHSWICMSDGSLGSLHRWRSQRIAKYWSCELQDTLAQLFFWAAEHLTYSTYTSLAVLSHSDWVSTHYWLQRARLRVLFNFSLA